MKNKFFFNISVCWIAILFIVGLAILLIAPKGELVSDAENRILQAMPEVSAENIMSGEFSQDFELFMSDKFFGRTGIVSLASEIRSAFSILDFDDMLEFGDGVEDTFVDENFDSGNADTEEADTAVSGGDVQPEADEAVTEAPEEEERDESNVTANGSVFSIRLNRNDGESIGILNVNDSDIRNSARIVNELADILPEGGNAYYLSVLQAWKTNRYINDIDSYSGWENSIDPYMQTLVSDNVSVLSVTDIFEEPIRNKEYVFFRTDTHWTPLGAHYAYSEIMCLQGTEPIPYDAYPIKSLDNFLGTYYDMYQTPELKSRADRLDVLTPVVPVKNWLLTAKDSYKEIPMVDYSKGVAHDIYLGGNLGPLTVLRSEAGTGRKALMIKDSFGLIISVYLSAHYDELYLIDPRFYDEEKVGCTVPQLIGEYDIDDVFFIVSDINGHGKDFTTKYTERIVRG